eukprot:SAG11_NODE_5221_length_1626_cov_1.277014_2_plen_229_part_00
MRKGSTADRQLEKELRRDVDKALQSNDYDQVRRLVDQHEALWTMDGWALPERPARCEGRDNLGKLTCTNGSKTTTLCNGVARRFLGQKVWKAGPHCEACKQRFARHMKANIRHGKHSGHDLQCSRGTPCGGCAEIFWKHQHGGAEPPLRCQHGVLFPESVTAARPNSTIRDDTSQCSQDAELGKGFCFGHQTFDDSIDEGKAVVSKTGAVRLAIPSNFLPNFFFSRLL